MSTSPSVESHGLRAHLELLRAPLLFTPTADVLGGVAWSATLSASTLSTPPIALAALCGTALLVSGMAHNAWVDRKPDAIDKPDRPLARGAVSARSVHAYWLGGAAIALALSGVHASLLLPALGVLLASHSYHWWLKRNTLGGCIALGAARACDMGLGLTLFASSWSWTLAAPALLYGGYVGLASWHAAGDDRSAPTTHRKWQPWHAPTALLIAVALCLPLMLPLERALPASAILLLCALRVLRKAAQIPAPALTGVLLSNLPWLAASVACAAGQPLIAALAAALFFAAAQLRRVFPPS